MLCHDRAGHRIHVRLQFRWGDQQDAGQRPAHGAQWRDHHQYADEGQDGGVDIWPDPGPRRALYQHATEEGHHVAGRHARRHHPVLCIQRDELRPDAAAGKDDRRPQRDVAATGHQRIHRIDQRIQRRADHQRAADPQHDRLQVPEAHGEALVEPRLQRIGIGGQRNQPRDQQRQPGHDHVDQAIDAVEDDQRGIGQQAEHHRGQCQQQCAGNRQAQHALFGGGVEEMRSVGGHAWIVERSHAALPSKATMLSPMVPVA
ncbi:hypothetical protein G6F22_009490 [Rhizopus arrhizus]|nr:hypothetical protein G6F22_009490 [Rhizopus arrhizus]